MTAVADPVNHPVLCDTMTVRLLDTVPNYTTLFTSTSVISTTGYGTFNFSNVPLGRSYFIQLIHRNSLTVFSKYPVFFSTTNVSFDFTVLPLNLCQSAANSNDGYALLYSGDLNQDGFIDTNDFNILEIAVVNLSSGYIIADLNGDHVADAADFNIMQSNAFLYVWGGHPYSCLAAGVSDLEGLDGIGIYPNPATQSITVSFSKPFSKEGELEVFNSLGEKISQWALSIGKTQTEIDISRWASGIYLCKLTIENTVAVSKFIKQ